MQILGGRAVVEPDGKAVAPVRRDAGARDVAAAAGVGNVEPVAPVEGDPAVGDVDVGDAAEHVDSRDVPIVRDARVVDVDGRAESLGRYAAAAVVRYRAARHV